MTKCTESAENLQLRFDFQLGKPLVGSFDGGKISTDGGLVLLRQMDDLLGLTATMSEVLTDSRKQSLVVHELSTMIQQRIYAIAAGYEDVNDAAQLRFDPMHKICAGAQPDSGLNLASQPTLSRWENSITQEQLESLQRLLVRLYISKTKKPPRKIVLDMDATCDEVHGYQQLSFLNGFYKTYCYLPMFLFDEAGFPLAAVLRPGNAAPAGGAARILRPVIESLRAAWPRVPIELRADAAFCIREVYDLCNEHGVTYFIGFKSNHALRCKVKELVSRAKAEFTAIYGEPELLHGPAWRRREEQIRFSSKPEGRMQEHFEAEKRVRLMSEVLYEARGWNEFRRVICRCDYTEDGPELRFIITNSKAGRPKWLYESKYCRRGQCENWIKELKMIKCDRLSCQEFNANQFRLLLHTFAYVLLSGLRERLGKNQRAISINSFQQRFVKIGVLVRETARRIWLHWSSTHPWQSQFAALAHNLRC